MSQVVDISHYRFVRWDATPRKPIEPLLAEVMATVTQLEADAGPQRLTIAEAADNVRYLAEELDDLVFDDGRRATLDSLRQQATDIMVAAARFVRDVCGER